MEQMTVNSYEELGLTKQDLGAMYETMVRARKIDERMWKLNRAGKIPFVVSCQGQEAAQVGAAFALVALINDDALRASLPPRSAYGPTDPDLEPPFCDEPVALGRGVEHER